MTTHAHDPAPVTNVAPAFALTGAWADNLLRLQKLQLELWFSWQKSLADNAQEIYDEWACRFAGGAPIDG